MDVSSLVPSERLIEITHPKTGEYLGIKITLLSLMDEKMVKIKRRIADNHLALTRKGKSLKSSEIEDNENLLIFEAMTGWIWEDDANWKGEKPEFNLKNVKEILNAPGFEWFKRQLAEAIEDESAFFTS